MHARAFASGKVLMQNGRPIALESKELGGHDRRWPKHGMRFFVEVHSLKAAMAMWCRMHQVNNKNLNHEE